ncbi:glycerophosphodiester phosphodiesterase family protein [Microbacterium sp. M28]|uniref:glycerophosphodiester phosphodiesterase family protein n=1 Tax=Microbacterium sp. M28 TaxID=2962064 RepID=UPI0021F4D3F2|nr:glycerophosphodiester phosphodiesterase family protein [Microbacterium sp. M28]UYO96285.1 glycerophosphodiester phosphodiesterase family protein [Microbacterium sp. M28]
MTTSPRRRRRVRAACIATAVLAGALSPLAAAASPVPAETPPASDRVFLAEDFESGSIPAGWNTIAGSWSVQDGALVGVGGAEDAKLTFGEHRTDFAIDVDVRFDSAANSARWLSLLLDAPSDGSHPWQQAAVRNGSSAANGVEFAQRTPANGWNVTDTGSTEADIGLGTWAHLRVEVNDNVGTWYIDGEKVMTTRQLVRTADGVQGLIANNSQVRFDNLVLTEIDPLPPISIRAPGETGVVVGHRGNSSVAPENTMPAFVSTTRSGADYFEIDIALTKDGIPVVMHDGTVDRTTDGTGAVSALTLDEIRALDAGSWFSPAFAGTKVPTFDEVLTYVAGGGADVVIEYKGDWNVDDTRMTVDMIEAAGVENKVLAQSFSATTVGNFASVAPDLPLAWLTGGIDPAIIATAEQLGADAVNPSNATAETVKAAHDAGLGVFVWTQNSATAWQSLTAMGVDGIITDRPDALVGWMQRYNQAPPTTEQPHPGENEQSLAVSVPEANQPSGEFTWRFSSQDVVSLGEAAPLGDGYVATGVLNDIEITDTRANPAAPWTLSGQASAFASGADSFDSSALGWTPRLNAEGAGAVPGAPVSPGVDGGLSRSAVLVSAPSDEYKGVETAVVTADLDLRLPLAQAAGDYTSTLTVTVIQ